MTWATEVLGGCTSDVGEKMLHTRSDQAIFVRKGLLEVHVLWRKTNYSRLRVKITGVNITRPGGVVV